MTSEMPDHLLASDEDRARVAEVLDAAYADGRLDLAEHQERMDRALAARTFGDLAPLTTDLALPVPTTDRRSLPGFGGAVRIDPSHQSPSVPAVAVFSATERQGVDRMPARTTAVACFGAVKIDLRDAVFEARTVTVDTWAMFGAVELIVPPGVRVVNHVVPVFGGVSSGSRVSDPDAPTVVLRGLAGFGAVDVKVAGAGGEGEGGRA